MNLLLTVIKVQLSVTVERTFDGRTSLSHDNGKVKMMVYKVREKFYWLKLLCYKMNSEPLNKSIKKII